MGLREDHLTGLILRKYPTKKLFAEAIQMPNSTLATILNDISRANLGNIQLICDGLGVSIDEIVHYDGSWKGTGAPATYLTSHETQLIVNYREKKDVRAVIDRVLEI